MPVIVVAKVGGSTVRPSDSSVDVRTSTYGTPAGGVPRQADRPLPGAGQVTSPGAVPQTALTAEIRSLALSSAYRRAVATWSAHRDGFMAHPRASARAAASAPL